MVSGGVVSIVTCYGLDGLGVRFSTPIQAGLGIHPASCAMCTGSLFSGVNQSEHGIDHLPYRVLRLSTGRPILLFPSLL
jgi:hypothetical protein